MVEIRSFDLRKLAWAAGVFEGEGCISKTTSGHVTLQVCMADEDVVEAFSQAVGGLGNILHYPGAQPGWKPRHMWRTGKYEEVQAIVAMFWPYLGTRRKARAKEILPLVKEYKSWQK